MTSRMDKYYNSAPAIGKRSQKNEQLYDEVKRETLEDFNVNSNVSVLGDNKSSINIEDLKELLDKKYQNKNTRRKINFDIPTNDEQIELEKTREYDINAVLEKAHENKVVDYEKERLKKIRDTQYDILKGLNIQKAEEEEKHTKEEEQLMTLINTITANELKKQEEDSLDLFADLKADSNTNAIPPLKEDGKDMVTPFKENQIDNSFYTKSFNLSKNDFADFKDLENDVKSNKILITILTIIVILALAAGVFVFLNIYFDWGII